MGKRKFRPGGKIISLDEVARQEHIYFYDKIYHRGWFKSWQFGCMAAYLQQGVLRYAVREEEQHEKSRRCKNHP